MGETCPYCNGTGLLQATYSARFAKLRQEKGVNQDDVAEAVHVSRAQIANLERGRGQPSVDVVIRAAKYFGCSTDYLLALSDNRGGSNE